MYLHTSLVIDTACLLFNNVNAAHPTPSFSIKSGYVNDTVKVFPAWHHFGTCVSVAIDISCVFLPFHEY